MLSFQRMAGFFRKVGNRDSNKGNSREKDGKVPAGGTDSPQRVAHASGSGALPISNVLRGLPHNASTQVVLQHIKLLVAQKKKNLEEHSVLSPMDGVGTSSTQRSGQLSPSASQRAGSRVTTPLDAMNVSYRFREGEGVVFLPGVDEAGVEEELRGCAFPPSGPSLFVKLPAQIHHGNGAGGARPVTPLSSNTRKVISLPLMTAGLSASPAILTARTSVGGCRSPRSTEQSSLAQLQSNRADMIDALDVCLLEIPDPSQPRTHLAESLSSHAVNPNASVRSTLRLPDGTAHVVSEAEAKFEDDLNLKRDATSANLSKSLPAATEESLATVHKPHLEYEDPEISYAASLASECSAAFPFSARAADATSVTATSAQPFTVYEWRALLLDIVDTLAQIDSCIYAELIERTKYLFIAQEGERAALDPTPSAPIVVIGRQPTSDPIGAVKVPTSAGGTSNQAQNREPMLASPTPTPAPVTSAGALPGKGSSYFHTTCLTATSPSGESSRKGDRTLAATHGGASPDTGKASAADLNQMFEEILTTACALATWATLKSILRQHLKRACGAAMGDGDRRGLSFNKLRTSHSLIGHEVDAQGALGCHVAASAETVSRRSSLAMTNSTTGDDVISVEWRSVIGELRELLGVSESCMAECILCASFLRDDGRELVLCMLQEPKARTSLERAMNAGRGNTPSETAQGQHPCVGGSATAPGATGSEEVVFGDLLMELEQMYEQSVFSSWITYLSATLRDLLPDVHAGGDSTQLHPDAPQNAEIASQHVIASGSQYSPSLSTSVVGNSLGGARGSEQGIPQYPSTDLPGVDSGCLPSTDKLPLRNGTFFCHLATAYFFCSKEWSVDIRQEKFNLLHRIMTIRNASPEMKDAFRWSCNESRRLSSIVCSLAGNPVSSLAPLGNMYGEGAAIPNSRQVSTDPCDNNTLSSPTTGRSLLGSHHQYVPEDVKDTCVTNRNACSAIGQPNGAVNVKADSLDGRQHAAAPVLAGAREYHSLIREELMNRIINMSWCAALHKRVEHCRTARPPLLDDAVRFANEERTAALTFGYFRAKQRALVSLINARLSAGKYQEALVVARKHFKNEKKEWTSWEQTIFSAIHYLQSMVQLEQVLAACRAYGAVIETLQFVLPQIALCEQMIAVIAPMPRSYAILRFGEFRGKLLSARIYLLKECWLSQAHFSDHVKTEKFFNDYVQCLRTAPKSVMEMDLFEAYMERGNQLMRLKVYGSAVQVFQSAVDLARRGVAAISSSAPHVAANQPPLPSAPAAVTTTSVSNPPPPRLVTVAGNTVPEALTAMVSNSVAGSSYENSFHADLHLRGAGSGRLTTAEEHSVSGNSHYEHDLELRWRTAESERMLALCFVIQAEHEVNVRERREKLSHAVNNAYASQQSLQRWQARGGTPKRMLTAVPCSLIVTSRALLLLGQSKKAALLLEPLIESKANAATVRPPMWNELLQPTREPLTAEDIVLRTYVTSVKIAVYQLYAQCLSKFDGERAVRATKLMETLLRESEAWLQAVASATQAIPHLCTGNARDEHSVSLARGGGSSCFLAAADHAAAVPTIPNSRVNDDTRAPDAPTGGYTITELPTTHSSTEEVLATSKDSEPLVRIDVCIESRSEALTAFRALHRGHADVANGMREVKIISGDAQCLLQRWPDALHEYLEALSLNSKAKVVASAEVGHPRFAGAKSTDSKVGVSILLKGVSDEFRQVDDMGLDDDAVTCAFMKDLRAVITNEEHEDCRAGEHTILSNLARVHTALGKPTIAIHCYQEVLAYATETKDALLEYTCMLRLARLFTSIDAQPEAQNMWEKVCDLAKQYEDQEVSRETTRNIVSVQEAAGMYGEAIKSAEELDRLATAAEGADAAADKRYALEVLANAHLQLAHITESLKALDAREQVQEKSGEWSGRLLHMRAMALLCSGDITAAVKVLRSWIHKAKQLRNWSELARANGTLAPLYSSEGNVFKARRCHVAVLQALSSAGGLKSEDRETALTSARWLVHDYYLNDEEVQVDPSIKVSPPIELAHHNIDSDANHGGATLDYAILNKSGDLSLLMNDTGFYHENSDAAGEEHTALRDEFWLDVKEMGSNDYVSQWKLSSTSGEMAEAEATQGRSSSGTSSGGSTPDRTDCAASTSTNSVRATPPQKSLAHVSLCNRPAAAAMGTDVLETMQPLESLSLYNATGSSGKSRHSAAIRGSASFHNVTDSQGPAKVQTLCYRAAIETMEWAAQLLFVRGHAAARIRYSPAEAVDLAMLSHRSCMFVFYFAEYEALSGSRYDVVIRPANLNFLIHRTTQVMALKDYNKSDALQAARWNSEKGTSDRQSPTTATTTTPNLKDAKVLGDNPMLSRRPGPPQALATEASCTCRPDDASLNSVSVQEKLSEDILTALYDLEHELWSCVRAGLDRAELRLQDAECVVIVPDVSLQSAPFAALLPTPHSVMSGCSQDPLGQQVTLVVSPCLTHLVQYGMNRSSRTNNIRSALVGERILFLPVPPPSLTINTGGLTVDELREGFISARSKNTASPTKSVDVEEGGPLPSPKLGIVPSVQPYPGASGVQIDKRTEPGVSSAPVKHNATHSPMCASKAAADLIPDSDPLAALSETWTIRASCTRGELISTLTSSSVRAVILLCTSSKNQIHVADGVVRICDLVHYGGRPILSPHRHVTSEAPVAATHFSGLQLIVVVRNRHTAGISQEPDIVTDFCMHLGCQHVLRVDLAPGACITEHHKEVVVSYLNFLEKVMRWGLAYPYALALRMTIGEARAKSMPATVWSAFTLVGAP